MRMMMIHKCGGDHIRMKLPNETKLNLEKSLAMQTNNSNVNHNASIQNNT